ncbi:MAG: T9SS type A sorting domain-containing protein [Flavobacteriales bacterium]|nr:T9SS type A sorting domain-containing protein [Flavobacteriales bacterium]
MNKRYASFLALATIGSAALAQSNIRQARMAEPVLQRTGHSTPTPAQEDRAVIWTNTFAAPSDWVATHPAEAFDWDWEVGVGLESTGGFPTTAIASSTSDDGYAMYDSDLGANQDGADYEKAELSTVAPIDLSAYPNVILEFQTMYRRYSNEQTYVVITTDPLNWPQVPSDTATVDLPVGIYPVWYPGELSSGVPVPNPTIKRVNISDAAGGQSTVYVRFLFYGIWGYTWYVDDVNIFEQLPYDVGLASNFISHTGDGNEFARVPLGQLGNNLNLGGELANFGINDQTNVVLHVQTKDASDVVMLDYATAPVDLASGVSSNANENVTITDWPVGTYTTTMWITTNDQANDGDPANDTIVRVFQVTADEYSLDGLGVYPDNILSSLGTASFANNPDGMFCFTNYFVREELTAYGLYIGINDQSVAGGSLQATLHDTTDVFADDPTAPLTSSADYTLTQADIDAGFVVLPFTESYNLDPAAGYFAGVKLFSVGNTFDIRINDDFTVPQPGSYIYLPEPTQAGDEPGTAGNGNAFVIRLLSDPTIGMEEREELTGVNLFPNPTSGLVNVNFTVQGSYNVELINALGETVATQRLNGTSTVDLSGLAKGVYSVRISNKEKATVQRISLN